MALTQLFKGKDAGGVVRTLLTDIRGRLKISHGQPDPVTGDLTAIQPTPNAFVTGAKVSANIEGMSDALVYLAGAAHAGYNLIFEQSFDSTDGVNGTWYPVLASNQGALAAAATSTGALAANGTTIFRLQAPGANWVSVRTTARTSGTLSAAIVVTTAASIAQITATIAGTATVSQNAPTLSDNSTALTRFQNNALTDRVLVRNARARWHKYHFSNPNASTIYIQCFNVAAIASVTLGTTAPAEVYAIPPGGVLDGYWTNSTSWTSGLVIAATTTPTGSVTAPTGVVAALGVL